MLIHPSEVLLGRKLHIDVVNYRVRRRQRRLVTGFGFERGLGRGHGYP